MRSSLTVLAGAAGVSARVFDSLNAVPNGWTLEQPALDSDKLALKIALKQQHAEALEQAVLSISTPGSPDYGKHLDREELRRYVAPSSQATDVSLALVLDHDDAYLLRFPRISEYILSISELPQVLTCSK